MSVCMAYVTVGDEEEALFMARLIVQERLAACANLLGRVQSIYRWKGEVCEEKEVVLLFKTTDELKEKLMQRIKELHSYECPCIVFLPIESGNPDFLSWVVRESSTVDT